MHLCISLGKYVFYQHFDLNSTFEQLPWDMEHPGAACSKVGTHWSKSFHHCTDTWRENSLNVKGKNILHNLCIPVIIFLFHYFLLLLHLLNNLWWQRGNQNPKVFPILNLEKRIILDDSHRVLKPVLCPNLVQLLL